MERFKSVKGLVERRASDARTRKSGIIKTVNGLGARLQMDPFGKGVKGARKYKRNEPCPCGSERKYKDCCLGNHHRVTEKPTTTGDTYLIDLGGNTGKDNVSSDDV